MPKIIRDQQVVENDWKLVGADHEGELPTGDVLVPLNVWNDQPESVSSHDGQVGLWLDSSELPEQIEGDMASIPVIAVNFPVFADGRGFSIGRLLRERFGYQGELRAIGEPIRDQLHYLRRCGFNAFDLAEHYDPEEALDSLVDFGENYQASVEQPVPLFRRRD